MPLIHGIDCRYLDCRRGVAPLGMKGIDNDGLYRIEAVRTWLLERERQVERKASAPRAGGRK